MIPTGYVPCIPVFCNRVASANVCKSLLERFWRQSSRANLRLQYCVRIEPSSYYCCRAPSTIVQLYTTLVSKLFTFQTAR